MQDPEGKPLSHSAARRENFDMSNTNFSEEEKYTNTYTEDDDALPSFELPRNGRSIALIIGIAAGLIMALIQFMVPFLNTQAFQLAATQNNKMSYHTALTVTSLNCLSIFLAIVICAFTGYFVGRYAVQRRLGFFAGLLAGGIYYLSSLIIGYIPTYPGNITTPTFAPVKILFLLIAALFFGCISLLVTWMITRRHPYYAR